MKVIAQHNDIEVSIELKYDAHGGSYIISSGDDKIFLSEELMYIFKENLSHLENLKFRILMTEQEKERRLINSENPYCNYNAQWNPNQSAMEPQSVLNDSKKKRIEWNEYIRNWTKDFIDNQEPLGSEFQKVLNENYWELLE